jgi:hypothetical protein
MSGRRSGRLSRRAATVAHISIALLGLTGCRSGILAEESALRPESRLAARVSVLEGTSCPGQASVVTVPEQCVWPESEARSRIMTAVVQVVVSVGADGHPDQARVLRAPDDHDFAASAIQCALRVEYRPHVDESGAPVAAETCPVTLKLTRYASDVAQGEPPPFICAPVRSTYNPSVGNTAELGGSDCSATR